MGSCTVYSQLLEILFCFEFCFARRVGPGWQDLATAGWRLLSCFVLCFGLLALWIPSDRLL